MLLSGAGAGQDRTGSTTLCFKFFILVGAMGAIGSWRSAGVAQGCIKYGLMERNALPAQLHFNPSLASSMEVLVTTNSYCDR